jgi:hydrogenase maturation protease
VIARRDQEGAPLPSSVAGRPPPLLPGDRVLLLGVGNDLRGDDGAGPYVVRALEGSVPWTLRSCHGLVPDLVDELARSDVTIVVDAHADPILDRPTWTLHTPAEGALPPGAFGHHLDLAALAALTQLLYGRAPVCATLALPARSFDLGEAFSPLTTRAVEEAIDALAALDVV